jgi:hypothetical protein
MAVLVRQWDSSAETQAGFARRHGISHAKFRYWRRRVLRDPTDAVTFTRVQVVDDPAGNVPTIDVTLSTGDRLAVRAGASVDLVRAVVSALRAAC